VVGNDGLMGLRRVWTVSHGHLDHSRDSLCNRYGLALTIARLVTILVSMASYLRAMSALPLKADISPQVPFGWTASNQLRFLLLVHFYR
jgi:hypothetical protein